MPGVGTGEGSGGDPGPLLYFFREDRCGRLAGLGLTSSSMSVSSGHRSVLSCRDLALGWLGQGPECESHLDTGGDAEY